MSEYSQKYLFYCIGFDDKTSITLGIETTNLLWNLKKTPISVSTASKVYYGSVER